MRQASQLVLACRVLADTDGLNVAPLIDTFRQSRFIVHAQRQRHVTDTCFLVNCNRRCLMWLTISLRTDDSRTVNSGFTPGRPFLNALPLTPNTANSILSACVFPSQKIHNLRTCVG